VATAFQRVISTVIALATGIGPLAVVIFDVVFLLLLARPTSTYAKRFVPVFLFISVVLFKSLIDFMGSDMSSEAFLQSFAGFRRAAIPFVALLYFAEKLREPDTLEWLSRFLRKWLTVVVVIQVADFVLMQVSGAYRAAITAFANAFAEVFVRDMLSHIPLIGFQPHRAHGLAINYHASGLYVLLLYAFNLKVGRRLHPLIHAGAAVAVLAGGSLQNLGVYMLLLAFNVPVVFRNRWRALAILIAVSVALLPVAAAVALPGLGNVYMFEYFRLALDEMAAYYSQSAHWWELLWGMGGVAGTGREWTLGPSGIDLGDVGILRIILESGLVVWGLWFGIVAGILGRAGRRLRTSTSGPWAGSYLALIIGIISLIHYPVLFTAGNITLLMLFLAIIDRSTLDERSRRSAEPFPVMHGEAHA
jgi:hypothetical protein